MHINLNNHDFWKYFRARAISARKTNFHVATSTASEQLS